MFIVPVINWWSKKLDQLREAAVRIRKARRYIEKHPNKKTKKKYSQADQKLAWRVYNRECKKANSQSYRELLSGTDTLKKMADLYKMMNRVRTTGAGILLLGPI